MRSPGHATSWPSESSTSSSVSSCSPSNGPPCAPKHVPWVSPSSATSRSSSPTTARTSGPTSTCSNSTTVASQSWSPACRPTISAPPVSCGAIRSTTGTPWHARATRGGSRASEHLLELVDLVRIDHFRGFEAAWEVPAGATTAVDGAWVKGPGSAAFEAIGAAFGGSQPPVIAEDLGVITDEVRALLEGDRLPGHEGPPIRVRRRLRQSLPAPQLQRPELCRLHGHPRQRLNPRLVRQCLGKRTRRGAALSRHRRFADCPGPDPSRAQLDCQYRHRAAAGRPRSRQ